MAFTCSVWHLNEGFSRYRIVENYKRYVVLNGFERVQFRDDDRSIIVFQPLAMTLMLGTRLG